MWSLIGGIKSFAPASSEQISKFEEQTRKAIALLGGQLGDLPLPEDRLTAGSSEIRPWRGLCIAWTWSFSPMFVFHGRDGFRAVRLMISGPTIDGCKRKMGRHRDRPSL